ncbi:MAG: hydantoinase/oxoprolinase family protein [Pseudomonadales bacterium]|nr:hydantoinase/oxoprolinase family protein [Pseudomonadales bacterium]
MDTGGTFTDFVLLAGGKLRVHKVLSTPEAPERAILQGIEDMDLTEALGEGDLAIVHGTTVATNATLEGKGVRTAYITNEGLKDVLSIGRQIRAELYNLAPQPKTIPVEDELLFVVSARIDALGNVVEPLSPDDFEVLKQAVDHAAPEAIAINLLFSFLDDGHEREIESLFEDRYFVSRSSFVMPEYREYERGIATWLNACIGPLIKDYLLSLKNSLAPCPVSIMQSSGVTIEAGQASNRAVNLLLSGPVGGLAGAGLVGGHLNDKRLMTFDMGGTSSDVSLLDGEIKLTNEGTVANFPIAVPMADIHTIGAGGGSIAFVDKGGLLQVGPASAGAKPGPACYGLGGKDPTVTDANLVLGRLRKDAFLGGRMSLDEEAAIEAMKPLAEELDMSVTELAFGIIEIANEHMTQALRVISVQRGFDPREFVLVCFGGAGGLHFCELADALEMTRALVPIQGGVLSALGMLATPPGRELARTHTRLLEELTDDAVNALFDEMRSELNEELAAEGVTSTMEKVSLDLRYQGQSYALNIPWSTLDDAEEAFHDRHETRYGHRLEKPIELLNLRMHLEADVSEIDLPAVASDRPGEPVGREQLPGFDDPVPVYRREELMAKQEIAGPALITEQHSTTLIQRDWIAVVDSVGNLVVEKQKRG